MLVHEHFDVQHEGACLDRKAHSYQTINIRVPPAQNQRSLRLGGRHVEPFSIIRTPSAKQVMAPSAVSALRWKHTRRHFCCWFEVRLNNMKCRAHRQRPFTAVCIVYVCGAHGVHPGG